MKRLALLAIALVPLHLHADTNALRLVQTIPLPDVRGRIDHFALDAKAQRLFLSALGNDTVEVLDLASGKHIRTLGDCSEPQGVAFAPPENHLLVANGGSGVVKMLDATSCQTLHELKNLPDADNARYDAGSGLFYVGYGGGALAVINATNGGLVASIPLDGHPESFQLEKHGPRLFVNVPDAGEIEVVDRNQRKVVGKVKPEFGGNFPMALDEANHRLFISCRRPARLLVLDTADWRKIGEATISGDADDLYFDAKRQLIYASCGEGYIDVIDADHYQLRGRIPTRRGARTGFFWPERNEFFLAVPAGMISGSAEVQIYQCH